MKSNSNISREEINNMTLKERFIFIPIKYEEFENKQSKLIDKEILEELSILNKIIITGMNRNFSTVTDVKNMILKDVFEEILIEYESLSEEMLDNIPITIIEEIARFNIKIQSNAMKNAFEQIDLKINGSEEGPSKEQINNTLRYIKDLNNKYLTLKGVIAKIENKTYPLLEMPNISYYFRTNYETIGIPETLFNISCSKSCSPTVRDFSIHVSQIYSREIEGNEEIEKLFFESMKDLFSGLIEVNPYAVADIFTHESCKYLTSNLGWFESDSLGIRTALDIVDCWSAENLIVGNIGKMSVGRMSNFSNCEKSLMSILNKKLEKFLNSKETVEDFNEVYSVSVNRYIKHR